MGDLGIQNLSLLQQMDRLNKLADSDVNVKPEKTSGSSFSQYVKEAVNSVDMDQKNTLSVENKYVHEDPSVSLSQVMIQMQKSSVSLNAMVQVRNRVIDAYKNITSMNF